MPRDRVRRGLWGCRSGGRVGRGLEGVASRARMWSNRGVGEARRKPPPAPATRRNPRPGANRDKTMTTSTQNTTNENTQASNAQAADHNAQIDAMSKKDLVAMAVAAGTHTKSAANRIRKEELAAMFHVEQPGMRRMKAQLDMYRGGYQDTVSASGNKSLHNGDGVASKLAGMEPRDVVAMAERLLDMAEGSLWTKYQNLNKGQQRMNAGNRIRNAVKRGDITAEQVEAA